MISPNLLDIWPVFFLILSRYGTAHFLIVFRTSGDGYSLLDSKKYSPRHNDDSHITYIHSCHGIWWYPCFRSGKVKKLQHLRRPAKSSSEEESICLALWWGWAAWSRCRSASCRQPCIPCVEATPSSSLNGEWCPVALALQLQEESKWIQSECLRPKLAFLMLLGSKASHQA